MSAGFPAAWKYKVEGYLRFVFLLVKLSLLILYEENNAIEVQWLPNFLFQLKGSSWCQLELVARVGLKLVRKKIPGDWSVVDTRTWVALKWKLMHAACITISLPWWYFTFFHFREHYIYVCCTFRESLLEKEVVGSSSYVCFFKWTLQVAWLMHTVASLIQKVPRNNWGQLTEVLTVDTSWISWFLSCTKTRMIHLCTVSSCAVTKQAASIWEDWACHTWTAVTVANVEACTAYGCTANPSVAGLMSLWLWTLEVL